MSTCLLQRARPRRPNPRERSHGPTELAGRLGTETVEEALKQEAIELYLEPVEDDVVMEEGALVQEIEL